jgi:Uma2 family endonuclease
MSVSMPKAQRARAAEPGDRNGAIPPLESGDRLTRDEFERRYEAMPALMKAELVEGVVYVASPVRQRHHGKQHYHLLTWLGHYEAGTPGVEGGDNSTVRLDLNNEPQPDCVFFIKPENGGQVHLDDEGYLSGAPDLVAEVAASSASYDLHDKLDAYRRNGVREYLVCRVLDGRIDWFVLRGGQYELIVPADDGTLRSTVFPGLWLDPSALLRGDIAAVLSVVRQGLDTPEHEAFRPQLQRPRDESRS